nr:hypothetical protein CFP56_54360 [Quercus suber]
MSSLCFTTHPIQISRYLNQDLLRHGLENFSLRYSVCPGSHTISCAEHRISGVVQKNDSAKPIDQAAVDCSEDADLPQPWCTRSLRTCMTTQIRRPWGSKLPRCTLPLSCGLTLTASGLGSAFSWRSSGSMGGSSLSFVESHSDCGTEAEKVIVLANRCGNGMP